MSGDSPEIDGARYFGHDLDAMSVAGRYGREIVRDFSPYLGSHVVEVGAGIGNISVLLLEQGLTRARVGLYDRFVVPVTSVVGRWVSPPIGKNLVAVARRP